MSIERPEAISVPQLPPLTLEEVRALIAHKKAKGHDVLIPSIVLSEEISDQLAPFNIQVYSAKNAAGDEVALVKLSDIEHARVTATDHVTVHEGARKNEPVRAQFALLPMEHKIPQEVFDAILLAYGTWPSAKIELVRYEVEKLANDCLNYEDDMPLDKFINDLVPKLKEVLEKVRPCLNLREKRHIDIFAALENIIDPTAVQAKQIKGTNVSRSALRQIGTDLRDVLGALVSV